MPATSSVSRPHRAAIDVLSTQTERIERTVVKALKPTGDYKALLTVSGIGEVIAWTILLESGDLTRFKDIGHFASCSRCVDSKRTSNEKKKDEGNAYLAWAFFGGSTFCDPVSAGREAVLRKESCPPKPDPRREGVLAQTCARLLLRHARSDVV